MTLAPPVLLQLHLAGPDKARRLWFPLVLAWPLLVLGAVLALIVVPIVAVFRPKGQRLLTVQLAVAGVVAATCLFWLLPGLRVEVESAGGKDFRLAFD